MMPLANQYPPWMKAHLRVRANQTTVNRCNEYEVHLGDFEHLDSNYHSMVYSSL